MNRYSMLFTLLVASSFVVHSPQGRNSAPTSEEIKAASAHFESRGAKRSASVEPIALVDDEQKVIRRFQTKAQGIANHPSELQVMIATVPHPTETQLASAFDHNVEGLLDGMQDAGYLFDSAWIPWTSHESRGGFDDDEKEKNAQVQEDTLPGILMFRKIGKAEDYYAAGVIVFLISEKPTEGIALTQLSSAMDLLQANSIPVASPIRILGPAFSGSFASLISAARLLHEPKGNERADFLIRSGGVSGGEDAKAAIREIAREMPGTFIDFGSTRYDNVEWIQAATCALGKMGIEQRSVATLSEGESAYGHSIGSAGSSSAFAQAQWGGIECAGDSVKDQSPSAARGTGRAEKAGPWSLSFPRDISSLRQEYEKQGIFNASVPAQPWTRILSLNGEHHDGGDSVHTFGGAATVAAQEAVLFGISEFLKIHGVGAVIVSATNEEDRYFLSQFLHAHNASVRVVVVGSTRTFMRGSTAQFRGDMAVDDFPMFPRLRDWTGKRADRIAHLFADSEAQGTYFAALDLFKDVPCSNPGLAQAGMQDPCSGQVQEWYPEYSAPNWEREVSLAMRPPMYVAALGSNALWPVAESPGTRLLDEGPGAFRVEMPFTLFEHDHAAASHAAPPARRFPVGRSWKDLFLGAIGASLLYCVLFWFANPVNGVSLTSFEPSPEWRFWLFKVTLPALVVGCAFQVLAKAVEVPSIASSNAVLWWRSAEVMSVLAPAGVALAAATKAVFRSRLGKSNVEERSFMQVLVTRENRGWFVWMCIALLPALGFMVCIGFAGIHQPDPFAGHSVGSILNCYREMYVESGLSLIPTGLLFLMAFLMWASQAGNGAALFEAAPELPEIPGNPRISQQRADLIAAIGRPLSFHRAAQPFWMIWIVLAAGIVALHYCAHPFVEITTLESYATTCVVRGTAGAIAALILLDVLQFLALWKEFRGFLRALDREAFKRSFVPIQDFKWSNLWSFSGISLQDRRAILGAQIKCVIDLASSQKDEEKSDERGDSKNKLEVAAWSLRRMVAKYSGTNLTQISSKEYRDNLCKVYHALAVVGTEASLLIQYSERLDESPKISANVNALQRALRCHCAGSGRFGDEAEALARLPERVQTAERLLCLIYIGFIQTVIARLHTLLISVASMFSLVTLGIAIYPFVPFMPLLLAGFVLFALIGWAFFEIFSEMDTDPILSRIVNSDDSKLQGNFYRKYAEAIALPLLTLGSSLLPGGTGRLLELAQTLLSQGQ